MKLKIKKPEARDTVLWGRSELNMIYLFSEFIDNAKASYENMVNKNPNLIEEPKDVNIEVNEQGGFISVTDFAEGMNVIEALEYVGRDHQQYGKTNQYYLGLKNALNYFGNYSILISERIENGKNIRSFSPNVYGLGLSENEILLKPRHRTGTKVIMFTGYEQFKEYSLNLFDEVVDFDQKEEYLNIFKSENTDTNKINNFFKDLHISSLYLMIYLNQRYNDTPKFLKNFNINFKMFDSYNNLVKTDGEIPELHGIDYKDMFGFVPSIFLNDEKNRFWLSIVDSENSLEYFKIIEDIYLDEFKAHKSKIKIAGRALEYPQMSIGEYMTNSEIVYTNNSEFKFKNDEWKNYKLAKDFLEKFWSEFFKKSDKPFSVEMKLKNLETDSVNVFPTIKSFDKDNGVFEMDLDFRIHSKYNFIGFDKGGLYKEKITPVDSFRKRENIVGFDLIMNQRAIFHGPNSNGREISHFITSTNPPKKFLSDFIKSGNNGAFLPNYRGQKHFMGVKVGGGANYYDNIFGSIYIPNIKAFNPGPDKASIAQQEVLEGFLKHLIACTPMNTIARTIHILENQKHGDLDKGLFYSEIYKRYEAMQKKPEEIKKELEIDKIIKIKSMTPEKREELKKEVEILKKIEKEENKFENADLDDYVLDVKNLDELAIKLNLEVSYLKELLNMKELLVQAQKNSLFIFADEKVFKNWRKQIILEFNFSNIVNDYEFVLEDGEIVFVTIKLTKNCVNNRDFELIKKFIEKICVELIIINKIKTKSISQIKKEEILEDTFYDILVNFGDRYINE